MVSKRSVSFQNAEARSLSNEGEILGDQMPGTAEKLSAVSEPTASDGLG
jgi:hypothetical protein